jgi:nucleotide-binding universal stress UspA family protein
VAALAQHRALGSGTAMRSYLVVIDETEEARAALRYAARRAARTGGSVEILAVVPPQEFVQWGGVQAATAIDEEAGVERNILVRQGDAVKAITELLKERDDIAALVLGAAAESGPGPLVTHFSGAVAGTLPCPLVVVPGRLGDESLDRLA